MTKSDLHIRLGKYDKDIINHLTKIQEKEPISQYVKKTIRKDITKNESKSNNTD